MVKDSRLYSSEIVSKVRLNAAKMEQYRDGRVFNEIELVLGFSSYVYWLAALFRLDEKGQDDFLSRASETAREIALDFVAMLKAKPELLEAVQKVTPFNPDIELVWGREKATHNHWKFSLTRAIILITRQLVYATVDFIASDENEASADSLYFLAFSELADLFQEAVVWASYVIGVEHAQELFNLEG